MLACSCGKPASPQITMLVPQIISTEVLPGVNAVTLYASIGGSVNLTECGFGISKDGIIREVEGIMDKDDMSFSATPEGLEPDTDYAFYAFISNGLSRIQTPQRDFRTLAPPSDGTQTGPAAPSVTFSAVTVQPSSRAALLGATLSETQEVTSAGFSVSKDGINFTDCTLPLSGNGISYNWEDLEPDTEYWFMAWAVQREVRVSSEKQSFKTEKETITVSFTGLDATAEAFSAQLTATIDDGSRVEHCGFGLSREGRTPVEYGAVLNGNTFQIEVGNLLASTDYLFYAFVVVDGSRVTSDFTHFRTLEDPEIHFSEIGADAEVDKVRLRARLSRAEGVLEAGFGLSAEGEVFSEKSVPFSSDGILSMDWDGLQAETHYRFYVFALREDGRSVSDTFDFYTKKAPYQDAAFVAVTASLNGSSLILKTVLTSVEGISDYGFGISDNLYDFIEYEAALSSDGFVKTLNNLPANTYYYYAFFSLNGNIHQSDIFFISLQ